MKVLQGSYLKGIESGKGKLKAIQIATEAGEQVVFLPKPLRAIAQQELTPGDAVRVWTEVGTKGLNAKKGKKSAKRKAKPPKLSALQIVPLSPKATIQVAIETPPPKQKSKKAKSLVTVQLCQKKNCCRKGGSELWRAFETASKATAENHKPFKLEPVGCLGGCKQGPNIRLLPANVKYRHVQTEDIDGILQRHA
ncbi:MAG: (2Fe-2S) ferredoxin domain-containing protein [Phormidesmis sp.]